MNRIKKIAIAGACLVMCGIFAGCSGNRPAAPTASQLTESVVAQPGTVIGVWQIDSFIEEDGKTQSIEDSVAKMLNLQFGVVVERDSEQFQRAIVMYRSIGIVFFEDGKFTSVVNVEGDAGRVNGTYKVENGEVNFWLGDGKSGKYQYDADTDTLSQTVDGVTTVFKRAQTQPEGSSEVGSLVIEPESQVPSETSSAVVSQ